MGLAVGNSEPPSEKDLALGFKQEFDTTYRSHDGAVGPTFEGLTFLSALEKARAQMKLLFVYIHAPHHYNTPVSALRLAQVVRVVRKGSGS